MDIIPHNSDPNSQVSFSRKIDCEQVQQQPSKPDCDSIIAQSPLNTQTNRGLSAVTFEAILSEGGANGGAV
ncbi:hypothetical protein [Microcoleus sp. EPA2]|uniref:hypothetical protein n=1 Tax=unclassified Microcoleus TaxID=2642155 RepID=UPI00312B8C13